MSPLQSMLNCCCPDCRVSDCVCANLFSYPTYHECLPRFICFKLEVAGGALCSACASLTGFGIGGNNGVWSGILFCNGIPIDLKIEMRSNGSQCLLCLSSVAMGVSDNCKVFTSYPDPQGVWTGLPVGTAVPGCTTGTLTVATPAIIPFNPCYCSCHTSELLGEFSCSGPPYAYALPISGQLPSFPPYGPSSIRFQLDSSQSSTCWRHTGTVPCGNCAGQPLEIDICCLYPFPATSGEPKIEDYYSVTIRIGSCAITRKFDVVICQGSKGGVSFGLFDALVCGCELSLVIDGDMCLNKV